MLLVESFRFMHFLLLAMKVSSLFPLISTFYLFNCEFNNCFSFSECRSSSDRTINKLQIMWQKRAWFYLKLYPGICQEGLEKSGKNQCQYSRSVDRNLDPGSNDFAARLLLVSTLKFGCVS
jgi:hypothetical protein